MAKIPTPDDVRKQILTEIRRLQPSIRPGDVINISPVAFSIESKGVTTEEFKTELTRMMREELISDDKLTVKGFEAM